MSENDPENQYKAVDPDYPVYRTKEDLDAAGGQAAAYQAAGKALNYAVAYLQNHAEDYGLDGQHMAMMGGSAGAMAGFYAIAAHLRHFCAFVNL